MLDTRLQEFERDLAEVIKTAAGKKLVRSAAARINAIKGHRNSTQQQRTARALKAVNARWAKVREAQASAGAVAEERVA